MLKMKKIILLLVIIFFISCCTVPKEVFNEDSLIGLLVEFKSIDHFELDYDPGYSSIPKWGLDLWLNIDIANLHIKYKGDTLLEIRDQVIAFQKQLKESVF